MSAFGPKRTARGENSRGLCRLMTQSGHPQSSAEACEPCDQPEGSDGAYQIGGKEARLGEWHRDDGLNSAKGGQDCGDEQQLARLDAQIEGQKRKRNIGLRQAGLLQRPGETKAVQQTKCDGYQPRIVLGEPNDLP